MSGASPGRALRSFQPQSLCPGLEPEAVGGWGWWDQMTSRDLIWPTLFSPFLDCFSNHQVNLSGTLSILPTTTFQLKLWFYKLYIWQVGAGERTFILL